MPQVAKLTAKFGADDSEFRAKNSQVQRDLQQTARVGADAGRRVGASFSGLSNILGDLLGGALRLLTGALGGLVHLVGSGLSAAFGVLKSVASGALGVVSAGLERVAGLAKMGALAAAGLVAAFATMGVRVNVALETTRAGLETLLRSGPAAAGLLGAIRKEALGSVFEFTDLADYSKKLLAFGFSARQVIPMIRTLGDVTAGLGGGSALLERLIVAFGQIRAKGTLRGEEAMQLQEAGIPVRELLGAPAGMDFAKMGLSADAAISRLMQGMAGRFGGLQARSMGLIPGLWSNIKDALNDLSATATTGLNESIKRALGTVLEFLSSLTKTREGVFIMSLLRSAFDRVGQGIEWVARQIGPLVERFAQWAATLDMRAIWDSLVQKVMGFWSWLQRVGAWVVQAWPAMWRGALAVTRLVVVEVAGLVGGLHGALQYLWSNASTGADNFAEALKRVASRIIDVIVSVGRMAIRFAADLSVIKLLGGAGTPLGALMAYLGKNMIDKKASEWGGDVGDNGKLSGGKIFHYGQQLKSALRDFKGFGPIMQGMAGQGGLAGAFGQGAVGAAGAAGGAFDGLSNISFSLPKLDIPALGAGTLTPATAPAAAAWNPSAASLGYLNTLRGQGIAPSFGAPLESGDPMASAAQNLRQAADQIERGAGRPAQWANARDAERAGQYQSPPW